MHKILKTFPYSADGVSVVILATDTEVAIRAELAAGLEAAGYIAPLGNESAPTPDVQPTSESQPTEADPAPKAPTRRKS